MATKYLDYNGLLYFWGKVKGWVAGHVTTRVKVGTNTYRSQENYTSGDDTLQQIDLSADFDAKADKVTNAASGNFAGLDANGNLTDSGHKHSDYKTTQSAVSDPTVPSSGTNTSLEFIDSISQNAQGVITPTKKRVANVVSSTSGEGGSNGLMTATDKEKLDGVEAHANNYSHPTTTAVAAAAVKVGKDNLGHVVLGDALAKGDVGLGNVTNDAQVKRSEMGAANGVATLDASGLVPSSQLPSYVDDVIESYPVSGATELSAGWLSATSGGAAFTPESGKIYVLMEATTSYDVNSQFRWGGTAYVKMADGGVSAITNAEIDIICV